MKRRSIALGLAAASFAADLTMSAEGKAWWSHVTALADDGMEGRKAGTEGHRRAARYVAEQFEKAGLKPAGSDGYLQPVSFRVRKMVEQESSLEIVRNGKAEPVEFGSEANLSSRVDSGKVTEADAVFVGYGLKVPEKNIDDLKGHDLKGKIAVILRGAPRELDGPLAAHAQSSAEQWKHLREAGVIGIASLFNPDRADIPWARATLARLSPSLSLSDPEFDETAGLRLSISVNSTAADRFLVDTGHTMAELTALDKSGQPLPKFPLKVRIRARPSFTVSDAVSENVLGVMPGSDPKLKNEYIVYSAHLDHLGVGEPVAANPDDRVYNGAMDNASGVASTIEAAKSLRGKKLARSVLFAAVTGEEGGLLGSKYFATRPTVPAGSMVADLNIDMFLPIVPLKAITVLGLDESDLGVAFAEVSGKFELSAKADPEPKRNRFIRSDQYSFIRRGIPSLAFKFHSVAGTPEQKVMDRWLCERYHAPSDDLQQPVNIEGAVQFNKVMTAFLERVANQAARPVWKESSFFRRYARL